MRNPIILAVLLVFMASSCTKDDAVSPCSSHATDEGTVKNARIPIPPAPSQDGQIITEPSRPSDPDGTGISDDGDDLSNNEKSRKKRR